MSLPSAAIHIYQGGGSGCALAGFRSVALVGAPLMDPSIQLLVPPILQGESLAELLEVISSDRHRLPDHFGVVVLDEPRSHVILRGNVTCSLGRVDGTTILSGADAGEEPWVVFAMDSPVTVSLTIGPPADQAIELTPFPTGITNADILTITVQGEAISPGSPTLLPPVPAAPPTSNSTEEPAEPDVLPAWPPAPPPRGSDLEQELSDLLGTTTPHTTGPGSSHPDSHPEVVTCPIRLPNGETLVVGPRVVLGRNPPEGAQLDGLPATRVQLDDPDRTLSRQHLALRVVRGEVTVEDLGSTNRSTVQPHGRLSTTLTPGLPVTVPPNTRVVLGGSVTLIIDPR